MASGPELFVVCKKCNSEVSPYITECPYCGQRVRKRAPKIDRGGPPEDPQRKSRRPRLSRLRPDEIEGIAPDRRPYATIALVVVSVLVSLTFRAGVVSLRHLVDLVASSPLDGDYWKLVTQLFLYVFSTGYEIAALGAIFLFGWLLERRHGAWAPLLVFFVGGLAGSALVLALDPSSGTLGANSSALALVGAWTVRDVITRRRGEEDDADLLGVLVIAVVLVLLPLAAIEPHSLAGLGGGVAGLLLGLVLARAPQR